MRIVAYLDVLSKDSRNPWSRPAHLLPTGRGGVKADNISYGTAALLINTAFLAVTVWATINSIRNPVPTGASAWSQVGIFAALWVGASLVIDIITFLLALLDARLYRHDKDSTR